MKHWQETRDIFARLAASGGPAVLAVVVRIEGSTYRRPGAKLLVEADGAMLGNVSGGCLEEDLRLRAKEVLKNGQGARVHYDTGGDGNEIWGFGLGCEGAVDVLLLPLPAAASAPFARQALQRLDGDQPFSLRFTSVWAGQKESVLALCDAEGRAEAWLGSPESDHAEFVEPGLCESDDRWSFFENLQPPTKLVVCGAGDDARPVVELAARIGMRVWVVDHRPPYLVPERFPGARERVRQRGEQGLLALPAGANTLVVIMTHNLEQDRAWLTAYLPSAVPYIGLLGPVARRQELTRSLPEEARARFFGPVGIDIGADGAEQIAVSIVAELLAIRSGRPAGHLRRES